MSKKPAEQRKSHWGSCCYIKQIVCEFLHKNTQIHDTHTQRAAKSGAQENRERKSG